MTIYRILLLILLVHACCIKSPAQPIDNYLQSLVQDKQSFSKVGAQYPELAASFYAANQNKTAWIKNENKLQRDALVSLLARAASFGLTESNYQFSFINNYSNGKVILKAQRDSVNADILFTDAAIHFFAELAYGNNPPPIGYRGLKFTPPLSSIPSLLYSHYRKNSLSLLVNEMNNYSQEIRLIQLRLELLLQRMLQKNFRDEMVKNKVVASSNTPLIKRLYQLGFIDSVSGIKDTVLKLVIKDAQEQFDLLPDGVIRTTLLQQLNVPLQVRISQLTLALNYYRWLHAFSIQKKVIVVNIPAAYLKVYDHNVVILQMKLIVGKKTTPTPTLLSVTEEVVLYPYWHVPYSIATKELLPRIKRNISYLDKGNYQVINYKGAIVNPYTINWRRLSARYFPYTIRQRTGCDNSLGLIKLNFYNPFGVYLHDTPTENLFGTNKRFYSHGCMRMEKPFEIGRLLLKDNRSAIDTLKEKGCLLNQSPLVVPLKEKMPVLVWYNPVALNAEGRLVFYEDIYGKFSKR